MDKIHTVMDSHYFNTSGTNALWINFAVMLIASLVFSAVAHRVPVSKRIFHILTALLTMTSALSSLALVSGYGVTKRCHGGVGRREDGPKIPEIPEIHCYLQSNLRMFEWSVTAVLLVANLSLLAGMSGAQTFVAAVANLITLFAGAAVTRGADHRWAWLLIVVLSYVTVVWEVGVNGTRNATARGNSVRLTFLPLVIYTFILWTVQLALWMAGQNSGKMTIDSSIIAFVALDILIKPVFGVWLLLACHRTEGVAVEINGYWSYGASGSIRLPDEEE